MSLEKQVGVLEMSLNFWRLKKWESCRVLCILAHIVVCNFVDGMSVETVTSSLSAPCGLQGCKNRAVSVSRLQVIKGNQTWLQFVFILCYCIFMLLVNVCISLV